MCAPSGAWSPYRGWSLITEYMSGALAAEERVRVEQHLLTCPPCTVYLSQMRATAELAAGLAPPGGEVEPVLVGPLSVLALVRVSNAIRIPASAIDAYIE